MFSAGLWCHFSEAGSVDYGGGNIYLLFRKVFLGCSEGKLTKTEKKQEKETHGKNNLFLVIITL